MTEFFDWLDLFIEANQGYIGALFVSIIVLFIMGKIAEWSEEC